MPDLWAEPVVTCRSYGVPVEACSRSGVSGLPLTASREAAARAFRGLAVPPRRSRPRPAEREQETKRECLPALRGLAAAPLGFARCTRKHQIRPAKLPRAPEVLRRPAAEVAGAEWEPGLRPDAARIPIARSVGRCSVRVPLCLPRRLPDSSKIRS